MAKNKCLGLMKCRIPYGQVKFNITLGYLNNWIISDYVFSFMMFKTVNLLEKQKPFWDWKTFINYIGM